MAYHKHLMRLAVTTLLATSTAYDLLTPQNDTFASTFAFTQQQILSAGINDSLANNIAVALNFERSNWANATSVADDPFYTLPCNASASTSPGSLLKLEIGTNTSLYTIPPTSALSRILYQTTTLNGTSIPASAYILFPYSPLPNNPVVGFGHGTSGGFADCAPSHYRNLWYHYITPFILSLRGYIVVAPDYAGQGVSQSYTNQTIRHPYTANPAHADDLFYAVEAAQSAFPSLSKQFVLMGHSQGGGATWAAAQRQARNPVSGYLGAIAASPLTKTYELVKMAGEAGASVAMLIAHALPDIFPGFDAATFLTAAGVARYELLRQSQGCQSAVLESFADGRLARQGWWDTQPATAFFNLTVNGGMPLGGPLLVLQGEADMSVPALLTDMAVNETCAAYPDSRIEYVTYPGVDHVPTMYASQRTWLDWIADRFAGVPVRNGCGGAGANRVESLRPVAEYQPEPNFFLEFATAPYEVA